MVSHLNKQLRPRGTAHVDGTPRESAPGKREQSGVLSAETVYHLPLQPLPHLGTCCSGQGSAGRGDYLFHKRVEDERSEARIWCGTRVPASSRAATMIEGCPGHFGLFRNTSKPLNHCSQARHERVLHQQRLFPEPVELRRHEDRNQHSALRFALGWALTTYSRKWQHRTVSRQNATGFLRCIGAVLHDSIQPLEMRHTSECASARKIDRKAGA